ncbi:hypothetical protein PsorP6_005704 [Peronosclerospora sorghi]|uniref:Uncharacterized protein n=1 Tax=Peronosclerospora sorghi TaxID=230839 RepID=A0ACC0W561_9STRA|nr:hypothetical protein PsorP6_005704 [Peronosclerospora sorghi]
MPVTNVFQHPTVQRPTPHATTPMSTTLDTSLLFTTRGDLLAYVQSYGRQAGYAIIIKRSDNTRTFPRVELPCYFGGAHRKRLTANPTEKQPTSGTRLIMCPWNCLGKQQKDGLWTLSVLCDQHNHDPATELAGHSRVRRLTEDNEALVYKITAAGVPSRQILTALRQEDKGSYALAKNSV